MTNILHLLTHPASAMWHEYFDTGGYSSLESNSTSYVTRCHIAPGIFVKKASGYWTVVAVDSVQVHSVPLASSGTTKPPLFF